MIEFRADLQSLGAEDGNNDEADADDEDSDLLAELERLLNDEDSPEIERD